MTHVISLKCILRISNLLNVQIMASSSSGKDNVRNDSRSPRPLPLPGFVPNTIPVPIRSGAESRGNDSIPGTVLTTVPSVDQTGPDTMVSATPPAGGGGMPSSLVTRVMSPNEDNANTLQTMGVNVNMALGCQQCGQHARVVYVCSGCYRYGHAECLQLEMLQGWGF